MLDDGDDSGDTDYDDDVAEDDTVVSVCDAMTTSMLSLCVCGGGGDGDYGVDDGSVIDDDGH